MHKEVLDLLSVLLFENFMPFFRIFILVIGNHKCATPDVSGVPRGVPMAKGHECHHIRWDLHTVIKSRSFHEVVSTPDTRLVRVSHLKITSRGCYHLYSALDVIIASNTTACVTCCCSNHFQKCQRSELTNSRRESINNVIVLFVCLFVCTVGYGGPWPPTRPSQENKVRIGWHKNWSSWLLKASSAIGLLLGDVTDLNSAGIL